MAKNKKDQQQEQNKERPAEEAAEPKQEAAPESKGSKIKAKKEDGEKEKLKAERDEYLSLLQRERADFENYKQMCIRDRRWRCHERYGGYSVWKPCDDDICPGVAGWKL